MNIVSIGWSSTTWRFTFGLFFRNYQSSWDTRGLIWVDKEVFSSFLFDFFVMSSRGFRFFEIRITRLGSIKEIKFSWSNGLDFSISSIVIIRISYNSRGSCFTIFLPFNIGRVGYISEESPSSRSNIDRISFNKPNNILFTWGKRERSSIFIVIERGRWIINIVIVHKFHNMEIFTQQIMSFFKHRVR